MLRYLSCTIGVPIVDHLHVDEDCYFIQEEANDADASAEDLVEVGESADGFSDVDGVHSNHGPKAVPEVGADAALGIGV